MASTLILELHKAVVALNNGAVRWIEEKSPRCAVDYLLTGIQLTKHIAHVQCTNAASEEDQIKGQILLERAGELLATSSCEGEQKTANDSAFGDALSVRVISTDYDPHSIYPTLTESVNSNVIKFPMVITDNDAGDDWSGVSFHSSVLLYNLGVVHDCLAVPQKANRIFELASQLVYVHLKGNNNSGNNSSINVFTVGKVLQFKVYLSYNLVRSCEALRVGTLGHLQALEEALHLIDAREGVIRTTTKDYASAA
jgi:hypothetical protein